MVNRRQFLEIAAGTGAALALGPELLRAHQASAGLIQRAIPSSGEKLPVVSYGVRKAEPAALKELFKTMLDSGVKVADVLHGGPAGEQGGRTAANELGIQDKFLWTSTSALIPHVGGGRAPKADPAVVRARLEEKFAQLKARIDLVMVGTLADTPTHLAVLRDLKKEGKVRYIGVHHLAWPRTASTPPFDLLEPLMRNEEIDFVATDYHLGDRRAEETILPLALERKIAFMAYFTFNRGALFKRVGATPLPEWAAEFDAKTWAQFFLKYVVSHPAVTVARTGTTKAAHLLDNVGGGIGRLPNEAMRKRMAQLVDAFPPLTTNAPQERR